MKASRKGWHVTKYMRWTNAHVLSSLLCFQREQDLRCMQREAYISLLHELSNQSVNQLSYTNYIWLTVLCSLNSVLQHMYWNDMRHSPGQQLCSWATVSAPWVELTCHCLGHYPTPLVRQPRCQQPKWTCRLLLLASPSLLKWHDSKLPQVWLADQADTAPHPSDWDVEQSCLKQNKSRICSKTTQTGYSDIMTYRLKGSHMLWCSSQHHIHIYIILYLFSTIELTHNVNS